MWLIGPLFPSIRHHHHRGEECSDLFGDIVFFSMTSFAVQFLLPNCSGGRPQL